MRKLVVLLLIVGILLGIGDVAGEVGEESSFNRTDSLYDMVEEGGDIATPCGGESTGGGGLPG